MDSQVRSHLWILAGPGCLLAACALLMLRLSSLDFRPVWLMGLILSILIGSTVSYLVFKEILERITLASRLEAENRSRVDAMRSTLDQAHALYRDKVEQLQQAIAALETEYHVLEADHLCISDERDRERAQSSSFHISLDDALDALREERLLAYLREQHHTFTPHDLAARYRQLREQFDEKALAYKQTRRRLFSLEGQLFVAEREIAERGLNGNSQLDLLQSDLSILVQENQWLEDEVEKLEGVVAELSRPKSSKRASSKSRVEQPALPLQFESGSHDPSL